MSQKKLIIYKAGMCCVKKKKGTGKDGKSAAQSNTKVQSKTPENKSKMTNPTPDQPKDPVSNQQPVSFSFDIKNGGDIMILVKF